MQATLPFPTPKARADGKNLSTLSEEAWHELQRAAHTFGYQNRPQFVLALTSLVTPRIRQPVPFEALISACQELSLPDSGNYLPLIAHVDEPADTGGSRKMLSLPDANWHELLRIAKLLGCSDRKDFVERLTSEITPCFRGFCALRDIARAVESLAA